MDKKKKRRMGIPRPGGNCVAPGNKLKNAQNAQNCRKYLIKFPISDPNGWLQQLCEPFSHSSNNPQFFLSKSTQAPTFSARVLNDLFAILQYEDLIC
jgi:hypothetical protein